MATQRHEQEKAFEMTGSELLVDKCGYTTEAQQAEIVLMAQAQQNLGET